MRYTKADIERLEGNLSGARLMGMKIDESSDVQVESAIRLGIQQLINTHKGYRAKYLKAAEHYRTHKPLLSEETALRMEILAKKAELKVKLHEKLLRKLDHLGVPDHLVKPGVSQ